MLKFFSAFYHAFCGLQEFVKICRNIKIQLFIAVLVIVYSFYIKLQGWQWVAIILSIGLVVVSEAFNTAIEKLADAVTLEKNSYIKSAKDISAGAVLIASIISIIIAIIVFSN